jgi:hypothetical protein
VVVASEEVWSSIGQSMLVLAERHAKRVAATERSPSPVSTA